MNITIEEAQLQDTSDIGSLIMNELGYPHLDVIRLADRIQQMLQNRDYLILVAKDEATVVGFIGVHRGIALELDQEYMRITALAVNKKYQHHGIGKQLIRQAECHAEEQGIHYLLVSSGLQRIDAHRFYERNGYLKTGYSFKKQI